MAAGSPCRAPSAATLKHSTDLGLAPANLKLESLSLRFSMTPAQQADLNQLLAAQLDPSSPSYHQWLTSEQFGARFGLSSSDLANVSSWLTSQGFTITSVAKSSTFITFSGTVAQVQQAFGTTIHNVSLNGEQHIANLTDPTLPSAIANVTLAVTGLNDFKLKPRSRARNVTNDSVQPGFTHTVGNVTSHYIAPGDLYTIYDYPPIQHHHRRRHHHCRHGADRSHAGQRAARREHHRFSYRRRSPCHQSEAPIGWHRPGHRQQPISMRRTSMWSGPALPPPAPPSSTSMVRTF